MPAYADTSFLVAVYSPESDSVKALNTMQRLTQPLPFTPFHCHELRTGLRLRVFRGEITAEQRKQAFRELDSDLENRILAHTPIPWTDTLRAAEKLGDAHTETLGVRSFDLLHIGLAVVLGATEFFTFDSRQASLARAAGFRVKS
ncbi:MAG TPA: type II toxin-antitoxin system VapC family toxin [Verrucomicrobiae bacterium]|nr:type II toxin-antitoxin system VapC family toxin [Verrucomicrobiae bacterium]